MADSITEKRHEKPFFKDQRFRRIIVGLVLIVAVSAVWAVRYFSGRESTDDAFIDGDIIVMSPRVSGAVQRVFVGDNQDVKAGAPLVRLDDRDYAVQVDMARAQRTAAGAEFEQAQADLERYRQLTVNEDISRQKFSEAGMRAKIAEASLEKAEAALKQAELNLSYTKIVAPRDGRVTRKSVEPGSYVQTGTALMAIVPPERWVTANLKETQLTHVREGQPVTIKVDAYPRFTLKGHVDSIQRGTGSRFSLLPPENATGNYVKVVQRVPVKIVFDEPWDGSRPLALGMSVVPTIMTK